MDPIKKAGLTIKHVLNQQHRKVLRYTSERDKPTVQAEHKAALDAVDLLLSAVEKRGEAIAEYQGSLF